jgi:tRNA modification GTPase
VVELQTHGGRAIIGAVLSALSGIGGLRPAEPGEFTRRAVQNGRLDLTQAEAIADLVNAETDAQRRQALRQYQGQLSALYEDWRGRLIRAAAWIEAVLDFPDEEIPQGALANSRSALEAVRAEISGHLRDGRRGEILRDGLHVAVIGPPNAGKSSLVNALARRDVAIVSETPGTTRDVLEVRLDLLGYPVILADTAGLRETADAIENEGVRRALGRAEAADLRLLVLDGALPRPIGLPAADIVVFNKADQVTDRGAGFWVSAHTGEGLADLVESLAERAKTGLSGDAPVLTRARHRHALEEACRHLESALGTPEGRPEIVAEHIRQALCAIGRITGRVDLDELLDVVFRDFCIGK